MTDSEEPLGWAAAHQERRQREREEALKAIAQACGVLLELGVNEVRIAYDGYGDSGTVDGVTATGSAGELELAWEVQDQLARAVETLLPEGWENNCGAFGEFVLDVPKRRLTREHNWRVESSEYDEEAWDV